MGILKVLKTTGLVGAGFALGMGFALGVQAFLEKNNEESKEPDFTDGSFGNDGFDTFGGPGFGGHSFGGQGFRPTGFGYGTFNTPGFGTSGFGTSGFGTMNTFGDINSANQKFRETLNKGVNTNNNREASVNPVLK